MSQRECDTRNPWCPSLAFSSHADLDKVNPGHFRVCGSTLGLQRVDGHLCPRGPRGGLRSDKCSTRVVTDAEDDTHRAPQRLGTGQAGRP